MARRPLRVRRHAAWLGVLVIVFGLLELNQWLPGGWPGGGGEGGFRSADAPRDDPSRVRPSAGLPPEANEATIRITLRAPDGGRAEGWRVRGRSGEAVGPDEEGTVQLAADLLAPGFTLEGPANGCLEHGPARFEKHAEWIVHLPEVEIPAPTELPSELRLRVLRAEDDAPLVGAVVHWTGWARTGEVRTTEQGVAVLPVEGPRIRVSVEAADRFRFERWIDVREGTATPLRLVRRGSRHATFVDAKAGGPVELDRARVICCDGLVLFDEDDLLEPLGRRDRIDLDRIHGGEALGGGFLEVGGKTHPVVRLRLSDVPATVRLSQGRAVRIRATDRKGGMVGRVRLEAHYVPPTLGDGTGPSEAREVRVAQTDHALLPEGVEARVLVEAGASAPRAVTVPPDPSLTRSTVKLDVGGRLKVETVENGNRRPVPRAEVVVVTVVDGVRLERRTVSGPDGVVRYNELPVGWIEIYARATGKVWAATTTEIRREGESTLVVALEDGGSVRLLVETPTGVPLEGVRVRAEAVRADPPDVVPPGAAPALTDRDGAIVLADLRDRTYRLHLSKPGYQKAVLEGVRPGRAVHFATLVSRTR